MPDTKGGLMVAIAAAAALLLAPSPASASPEALAASARAGFSASAVLPAGFARPSLSGRALSSVVVPASAVAPLEVDLGSILNKQLKTSLRYDLGGKAVWIGGAFDKDQNAFVTILVDGSAPVFHEVKALLDQEQVVAAGAARYKLYLSPNVRQQLKSEIVLENEANEEDKVRVTLKRMLDAAAAAGHPVTLGGTAYRVFYTDGVRGGAADPSSKVLTFLHVDAAGEIHVFIVPAELAPSDRIAVFKMHGDRRVGLSISGGRLRIFDNP